MGTKAISRGVRTRESAQLFCPLLQLPSETFLVVCSFLDDAALENLSLTCKRAWRIVADPECLWAIQTMKWKRRKGRNSILDFHRAAKREKLFWRASSVARKERASNEWERVNLLQRSISTSAAILLTRTNGHTLLLYTEDFELVCRNIDASNDVYCKIACSEGNDEHDLPKNCLAASDRTIYVCHSARIVESWLIANAGLVRDITFQTKRRTWNLLKCISNCWDGNFFVVGTALGILHAFDRRSGNEPVNHYEAPNFQRTLDIAVNADDVFSLDTQDYLPRSSSTKLTVWDRRTNRSRQIVPFAQNFACLEMRHGWVCVGGGHNELLVLNPMDDYESFKSYATTDCRSSVVTGLRLTRERLVTSYQDGVVSMFAPTDPLRRDEIVQSGIDDAIAIDYSNDTFAVAGDKGDIAVWRQGSKAAQNGA